MDPIMDETLTELLDSPLEGEDALLKAAGMDEDADEEERRKFKAILRLAGDNERLKEAAKRLAAAAGLKLAPETKKGRKARDEDDEEEDDDRHGRKSRMAKADHEPDLAPYEPLLKADPGLRPQIVLLAKAAETDPVAQSALAVFQAQAERIAKAEAKAADAERARLREVTLRKAEQFSALPVPPAELADAMLALEEVPGQIEVVTKAEDGKETRERLSRAAWFERLLKSMNAAVEAANEILLKSSGSDRPMPGSALAQLNALADQMVAKAEAGGRPISREQAFAKVLKANPALFKQYEAERTRSGRVN